MTESFDVVVIGAGPPGENAAWRTARAGLRTAIVEERLVGGECTYYGCVPSKTLIRPGDAVAAARRAPGAAEAVSGEIDVAAALGQRDYMTSDWDDSGPGAVGWLESEGIELFRGRGRLAGERAVEVASAEGTTRLEASRAVVVACGTVPLIPPVEGLAEAEPWTNRDATAAKEIPDRLLVLGGGPIGAELAQAFRRLGSEQMTVIEGGPRLLGREEPFASEEVAAAFEAEGITVITGARMVAASREEGGSVTARLDDGRGLVGDEILVAVGRRANTADIGLDTVGLGDLAGQYLPIDDRIRVRGVDGDWLYGVGDVNGAAMLTHMGKYQGRLAGDVILGREVRALAQPDWVPHVTFTDPQVCAVGLTEELARERGINLRVVRTGTGDVAGAYVQGNGIEGTSQIIVDEDRGVVVGATFTGPGVQELLHSATVAIAGEVPLDRLWHAVPTFPTVSEVWLRLLEEYGF